MSFTVIPTSVNSPMTVSKYTLPPPIYLPSSGGFTSSRFIEDVSAFEIADAIDSILTSLLSSRFTSVFFRSGNIA